MLLKKVLHILTGWGKAFGFIKVSTAEKELSKLRMSICSKCDKGKEVKFLEIVNGKPVYEHRLKCNLCGCPVLQKSLVVDEHCEAGKW